MDRKEGKAGQEGCHEEMRRVGTDRINPQNGKVSVGHVPVVLLSFLRTRRNGVHDALVEATGLLKDGETSVDECGLTFDLGGWKEERWSSAWNTEDR